MNAKIRGISESTHSRGALGAVKNLRSDTCREIEGAGRTLNRKFFFHLRV